VVIRNWIIAGFAAVCFIIGATLSDRIEPGGMTPQLHRIPQQLVLLVCIWLALAGLNRPRLPRAVLLLPGALIGRIATRGGSRRDGEVAMAIFASYVIGQFLPFFY
jgi:hypothetical protein